MQMSQAARTGPNGAVGRDWPRWMPDEVRHYIAHVELGAPLRAIARQTGCHPSTILRQVRRLESRRDDPLVDAALRKFGADSHEVKSMDGGSDGAPEDPCDDETLQREALRVLRRMCESGAVLAVVPDMEKAVVVRETPSGTTQRIAVVDTRIAQAMALKDWIGCKSQGRITRYAITATGRSALSQMLARVESQRSAEVTGMSEAAAEFGHAPALDTQSGRPARRVRYGLSETPLNVLARRRGINGKAFLSADLVAAGERLREDFELAQMGPRVTANWTSYLTGPVDGTPPASHGDASADARARVQDALYDLGPGLGDMALRCCCYLEGLEAAERDLGWAARSGKIVLRIALQRLKRFYGTQGGARGGMIG